LKPSFFTNEDLARLAPLIRIAFQGTWCRADRHGRLEDRPGRLKAEILPFDRIDMNAALQELHDGGFLTRYEVDGHRYIQINAFSEHQHPHPKEPSDEIPPPPSLTAVPRKAIAGNEMPRQAMYVPPGSSLTGSTGSSVLPPTPSAPQNGAARSLHLAEFQTFWQAYPQGHRTAKRKAEEKFIKARKAGVTLQVLLDALTGQIELRAAKTRQGEWVPEWCNPASWLHQRRWEDEIGGPPARAPNQQSPDDALFSYLNVLRQKAPERYRQKLDELRPELRAAYEATLTKEVPCPAN
jgi:hypothetical protein